MNHTAYIFKTPLFAECSNNGISKFHDEVIWIGPDQDIPENVDKPVIRLVKGNLPNTVKAVPAKEHDEGKWLMSGGAFVSSCDGRFGKMIKEITGNPNFSGAVSLHDRIE